jgi:phosphatidylserine decarboxylase
MKSVISLCLALALFATGSAFLSKQIVPEDKIRYNSSLLINNFREVMTKPPKVLLQYITPQHALTGFAGWLGELRQPWIKNYLIDLFIRRVGVDMTSATITDPHAYPTFNAFFIRQLRPELRPIAEGSNEIASPVDGFVSQIGKINQETLLQAKGFDFSLKNLLGGDAKRAKPFENGSFATFYLSPKDYHRVHMPYTGKLRETIYIPGDLFSVNQKTTQHVSNLFARNERLVCLFDTDIGPMAVILVGAMMVGSIHTVWHAKNKTDEIFTESYGGSLTLTKGSEMGHFQMGSTVIVLFGQDKVDWIDSLKENSTVRMGQLVAKTQEN